MNPPHRGYRAAGDTHKWLFRANVSQFPSCRQFARKLVFPKKRVGLIPKRCVAGVGSGVIDVVQSRHQMDFLATKLGFEYAEVLPWMVWFICRRNSPEVIPFVT